MSLVDYLENKINMKCISYNLYEYLGKEIKEIIREIILFIVVLEIRRY